MLWTSRAHGLIDIRSLDRYVKYIPRALFSHPTSCPPPLPFPLFRHFSHPSSNTRRSKEIRRNFEELNGIEWEFYNIVSLFVIIFVVLNLNFNSSAGRTEYAYTFLHLIAFLFLFRIINISYRKWLNLDTNIILIVILLFGKGEEREQLKFETITRSYNISIYRSIILPRSVYFSIRAYR